MRTATVQPLIDTLAASLTALRALPAAVQATALPPPAHHRPDGRNKGERYG